MMHSYDALSLYMGVSIPVPNASVSTSTGVELYSGFTRFANCKQPHYDTQQYTAVSVIVWKIFCFQMIYMNLRSSGIVPDGDSPLYLACKLCVTGGFTIWVLEVNFKNVSYYSRICFTQLSMFAFFFRCDL